MHDEAYHHALKLLSARDQSAHALRLKLERRFGTAAAGVIGRLAADGLLNDRRFAGNFVRRQRARGRVWNQAELEKRGLDPAVIREALADTEWPSVREALADRIRSLRLSPPLAPRDAARLSRSLERLGYDAEEVGLTLEEFL